MCGATPQVPGAVEAGVAGAITRLRSRVPLSLADRAQ